MWTCRAQSIRGLRHEAAGLQCQDKTAYGEYGGLQTAVLMDATGKTDATADGVRILAERIAVLLSENYKELESLSPDRQRGRIMDLLYDQMGLLMREMKQPARTFSSTFLALCIDPESGRYLAFHLGDGIILYREQDWNVLSWPQNGGRTDRTFLTTSENALQQLRVYSGSLENVNAFAMVTDGLYEGSIGSLPGLKAMLTEDPAEIISRQHEDDASLVLIDAKSA